MSHTDDKMNPIHFGSYPADLWIDRTGLIRIWITDEILVFVECAFFECFCCIRFTVDVHKHTRMLWFLSLVITLTRDIDTANLCRFVCPSIRPLRSGILWKRLNLLSWFFFSPYGSPIIPILSVSNIFTKFRRGHPCGGAKYRWGIKISRFWTNNSLYLANDTRYRHSYYRKLIATHMRSIKWCHFQWPWTYPNPVYNIQRQITQLLLSGVWSIEWFRLQWP